MSMTGGNSLFEQARDEGGIVDMFVDDIKDKPKKKKNLAPSGRMRYCPRCGERLSSMKPR